jgi:ParB family transcriptional regulator, chromosome partitioning protein
MTQTPLKKKTTGLGRGLSALLEDADEVQGNISPNNSDKPLGSISLIPIASIEANPFQPRTEFDIKALEELAASVAIHGVIQPITVRKMGYDKYQIISGERRTRAALMSGLTQIPAYVRTANDQGMLEMALIENIQRSDLNAIEIAMSYQRLLEECSLKQEELGERVGKDRTTVTNYLRLLKLPEEIQLGIKQGVISMGHARAMINMEDESAQMAMFREIIDNKLSVRAVESLVKEKKSAPDSTEKATYINGTDWDPEIDRITEEFHKKLRAAVHLKNGVKGKGKIVISYKNRDDLQRILSLIGE